MDIRNMIKDLEMVAYDIEHKAAGVSPIEIEQGKLLDWARKIRAIAQKLKT